MMRNFDEKDDPTKTDKQWAAETEMPSVYETPQRSRANILDAILNVAFPTDRYKVVEDRGITYLEYEGFGGDRVRKVLTEKEIKDIEISALEQIVGYELADYRGSLNRIRKGAIKRVIKNGTENMPYSNYNLTPGTFTPPSFNPPNLNPPNLQPPTLPQ